MKQIRTAFTFLACCSVVAMAGAQGGDLLGKGKGDTKPPVAPPKSEPPPKGTPPPRQDPPRQEPPPKLAPRQEPPPRVAPPRQDPPRQEPPPRVAPPRQEPPPRNEPPPRLGNPPQRGGAEDRSGPPLGRVEPPRQDVGRPQLGNDGLLGRRQDDPSRSGSVRYGTVNNAPVRSTNPQSFRTDTTSIIDLRSGSLQFQVRREESVRQANHYRSGYVQYDSRWCDDYFYYPHYSFTPVVNQCVISPWYYYPQLPGYILNNRITVINCTPFQFYGTNYNWSRPNYYSGNSNYGYGYRSTDLDYALEDLVTAFERSDRRSLTRLIPQRGRVSIALEGMYAYSLDPDDFYDMLLDAATSTRTRSYEILEVRTYRDEATVVARHEYIDPWGRSTRVYHYLRLLDERGGYVISEFGTSSNRWR